MIYGQLSVRGYARSAHVTMRDYIPDPPCVLDMSMYTHARVTIVRPGGNSRG